MAHWRNYGAIWILRTGLLLVIASGSYALRESSIGHGGTLHAEGGTYYLYNHGYKTPVSERQYHSLVTHEWLAIWAGIAGAVLIPAGVVVYGLVNRRVLSDEARSIHGPLGVAVLAFMAKVAWKDLPSRILMLAVLAELLYLLVRSLAGALY